MNPRILNANELTHGDENRRALLEILEAGLQASDPYHNTLRLLDLNGSILKVGCPEFEPVSSPRIGYEIFDLSQIDRIFVFGAGKGIQRVAQAIEDTLGDRLTGGHIIDKKGYPIILNKIGVTLGAHPIPDQDNVLGALKIRDIAAGLTERDLVFTCVGNGVSALLTLPPPGIKIEDIRDITYLMQIEHGASTGDLNLIRNSLDMMKSGRISHFFRKCHTIHILAIEPGIYDQLIHHNLWLHTLPDEYTTYDKAVSVLKQWNVWDRVSTRVQEFLLKGDPDFAPLRAAEFEKMNSRIFGVMPGYKHTAKFPPAIIKAKDLGFNPVILTEDAMGIEASQAGKFIAAIARTIERIGQPISPPCAIFSGGEMVVTVGQEKGIGGRNQEFTIAAALGIAGSKNIVIGSVDTDGTDGPGQQLHHGPDGMPACFAGGIVDGTTVVKAANSGIDLAKELIKHNTSYPLWKLNSGIITTPNISLNDLTVVLVSDRNS